MSKVHLWLRDEVKEFEKRTALAPQDAARLISENNIEITVERSSTRIFEDAEYEKVGCKLVDSNAWINNAPAAKKDPNTFVLGLKELPPLDGTALFPLNQRHIYFAHCYKRQGDWKDTMKRFVDGDGELLDLEFLNFDNGRRIAAFGVAAGFAGMAVGLIVWANQKLNRPTGQLHPFNHKDDLVDHVRKLLKEAGTPKVMVLGALGRCGKGSVDMAKLAGVEGENLLEWDINETKVGGPFPQMINDVDILVNDIYLSGEVVPFINKDMIEEGDKNGTRRLTVFVDVSCDVSNPHNPFPINNAITTFDKPSRNVLSGSADRKPLDVIAIDHLPSLTPRESSQDFSSQLSRHLVDLSRVDFSTESQPQESDENQRVWL
ncbi:saccharopine dehydrogenase LYS, partial [Acrasis kona]